MSYADPYYNQSNNRNNNYQDGADYDPYSNSGYSQQQPANSYNQAGYADDDRYPPAAQNIGVAGNSRLTKEKSTPSAGLYAPEVGHFKLVQCASITTLLLMSSQVYGWLPCLEEDALQEAVDKGSSKVRFVCNNICLISILGEPYWMHWSLLLLHVAHCHIHDCRHCPKSCCGT